MFVLRFSISVQVTKKMIGMIKEEGGEGVQISIGAGRLFGTQDQ